jgi:hypothetical protein
VSRQGEGTWMSWGSSWNSWGYLDLSRHLASWNTCIPSLKVKSKITLVSPRRENPFHSTPVSWFPWWQR